MSILGHARRRPRGTAGRRRIARQRRHARVMKKLFGTADRPRLVVFRSLKHLEAQLVDDARGASLTGISTRSKEVLSQLGKESDKKARSRVAGKLLAQRAKAQGIETVVFDRGGYRYHGRVKALAEGAREGGLKF